MKIVLVSRARSLVMVCICNQLEETDMRIFCSTPQTQSHKINPCQRVFDRNRCTLKKIMTWTVLSVFKRGYRLIQRASPACSASFRPSQQGPAPHIFFSPDFGEFFKFAPRAVITYYHHARKSVRSKPLSIVT